MSDSQIDDICDNIISVSVSPGAKQVAFGAIDGTLTLWDVDRLQRTFPPMMAHQSIINSVHYSTDGCFIVSASDDQTIGLWDAVTGQLRNTFTGHQDGVIIVGYMADARTIVSLSRDGVVFVWKAVTGEVEQQFRVSLDARSLATLSHDGEKLLAAQRSGVTIWSTISMESIKTITLDGPAVLCMALSQDATKVAFGMADNIIYLWDLEKDGMDPPPLEGGKELPVYVAWSPDGRTVSSVAQDATLRVWGVESRTCMTETHRTGGPITYSPGGTFIVCPGSDGFPDTWTVPQTPCYSSTSVLDLPATAVSMHRTTGAAESDTFWIVSGDNPVTNTPHLQRPKKPGDPPGQNIASRPKAFVSKALQRLFSREKESNVIALAKYKNPVVVASGTRRGVPQTGQVTDMLDSRSLDILDGVSDESEVPPGFMSTEPRVLGCSMCRIG